MSYRRACHDPFMARRLRPAASHRFSSQAWPLLHYRRKTEAVNPLRGSIGGDLNAVVQNGRGLVWEAVLRVPGFGFLGWFRIPGVEKTA